MKELNEAQNKEIDFYFARMANEKKSQQILKSESKDVYIEVADNRKKVKISQKKKKYEELEKNIYRGLMVTGVAILVSAAGVASRIEIGKTNISKVLNDNDSVEWFNDYYYFYGDHKLMDRWNNAANYDETLKEVADKMVNKENVPVNVAAIKLEQMGFSMNQINKTLLEIGEKESSTFLGRFEVAWDCANYEKMQELEAQISSISKGKEH